MNLADEGADSSADFQENKGPEAPGGITFRRLMASEERDFDRVLEIARSSFGSGSWTRRMFEDELGLRFSTVLLAADEKSGRIEAFAVLWNISGELQVNDIAVAPEVRRRGIARRLLTEAFRQAREEGAVCATLEVRVSNRPAILLYEQIGFHAVGRRRGYYQDGEDALLMDKDLSVSEAPEGKSPPN